MGCQAGAWEPVSFTALPIRETFFFRNTSAIPLGHTYPAIDKKI